MDCLVKHGGSAGERGLTADQPAFFRYHGLLAPGVRAFRCIGFPAKSAWVSACFLLPIVLLACSLWVAASATVAFSQQERVGVEYVRVLMPLLDAAQNRRRAAVSQAPDMAEAQANAERRFQATAAVQERLGATLHTGDAWKKVDAVHRALATSPSRNTPAATFAAHTELISQLLVLLNDIADYSNLTLDPDVNTFYVMDLAIFKQPQLIEQLGQMRGMGNAVLRSGQLDLAQREVIASALAFAGAYTSGVRKSMQRAVASDAAIGPEIRVDEALAGSDRFLLMVREQVLGDLPRGDCGRRLECVFFLPV